MTENQNKNNPLLRVSAPLREKKESTTQRRRGAEKILHSQPLTFIFFLFVASHWSFAESTIPTTLHDRFWEEPGPDRSAPGAPRLLIMFPEAFEGPVDWTEARYGGRVEPIDAHVTLNSEPLAVGPGGVFAGVRPLTPGVRESWRFEATVGEWTTVVERAIERAADPTPVPDWPLAFHDHPVLPSGEFWIRSDETFSVQLIAGAGHRAQVRIDETAPWQNMQSAGVDPRLGGRYTAQLDPPAPRRPPRLRRVQFRLLGERGGQKEIKILDSALRIATLPRDATYVGHIARPLASWMHSPDQWENSGNWTQGVRFPIRAIHPRRIQTGFEHGPKGWIDRNRVEWDWTPGRVAAPRLDTPEIQRDDPRRMTLVWPQVTEPLAAAFEHELREDGREILRVELPGARGAKPMRLKLRSDGPFQSVTVRDANWRQAPSVTVALSKPLWGYALRCDPAQGLRLELRARPALADATTTEPLKGLRIVIDAGHGGRDHGARGASGMVESDLNLVQAGWLERALAEMGAQVIQVRRGDEAVELDDRVALAWTQDPDLYLSLHHNAVGFDRPPDVDSGPRVYYTTGPSLALAGEIARELTRLWRPDLEPRVHRRQFRVNRHVTLCPSVLVETAFVTNPDDEWQLHQPGRIEAGACAIAVAVRRIMTQITNR